MLIDTDPLEHLQLGGEVVFLCVCVRVFHYLLITCTVSFPGGGTTCYFEFEQSGYM